VRCYQGDVYRRADMHAEALDMYTMALHIDPASSRASLGRALVHKVCVCVCVCVRVCVCVFVGV
jgi:hypothetical protein